LTARDEEIYRDLLQEESLWWSGLDRTASQQDLCFILNLWFGETVRF